MKHLYDRIKRGFNESGEEAALRSHSVINLPNLLTIMRILLIPLFLICMQHGLLSLALLVFTIAGVSDALDGLVARFFNQRTVLGAYLDPVADKLLLIAAFVSLALMKIIPEWLAVIVISRDVLIMLGIAIFTITNIKVVIRPTLVSKCTTLGQLTTVFYTLLDPRFAGAAILAQVLFWGTATLTIVSGFHYIYVGLTLLQVNHNHR